MQAGKMNKNGKMDRRNFLKKSGLLGLGVLAANYPVWSTTMFAWDQPMHNIPLDKGYPAEWIKSLYQKGDKIQYRKSKNELKYIGMPVGGLHTGTVYIGGDGRLWLWQIFNDAYDGLKEGIETKILQWDNGKEMVKVRPRDGSAYIEPAIADNLRKFEQGFKVVVRKSGELFQKDLNENDWDEIIFEPSYPSCKVTYSSETFPVDVELTAFSPFIPLDEDNSSLPLTTFQIEVRNKSNADLDVELIGWMENGVHKGRKDFKSVNKVAELDRSYTTHKIIQFSCDQVASQDLTAGDYGNMAFMCHDPAIKLVTSIQEWPINPNNFVDTEEKRVEDFDKMQVAAISSRQKVSGSDSKKFNYAVAWYFNNPHPQLIKRLSDAKEGYWFGKKFKDAVDVLKYYSANKSQLDNDTMTWVKTWNDTTLPYWFIDRTFVNIGTLATANTMRFATGRFWGWEGVGACAGTCTHVWQYGQAMGRIFPGLERNLRETTDYGVGFVKDSGAIIFRAEYETRPAIDGQAGVILRTYRDHQTSKDSQFLKTNWSAIKKVTQFILDQDKNGDGMTDTPMENTLDAVWEGEIAWIVGLCLAAVKAGELMAEEVGDKNFQRVCAEYFSKGSKNMDEQLFNGEYYIHRPNKEFGRKKLGSYNTCHIDQVYGQAWTFQVGLPRVNSKEKTMSALRALWNYNFTPDVGPYIKTHLQGRPYALAGDGGMVMNTNPKNEKNAYGENETWQLGYFHECMSGFEHQVAAHMLAEGTVDEGLILTRKIHDRYHALKRNPFNEIECSDHYARAMASYGTFISACGFTYHGPKKQIGFDPKINPQDFKAAFTAAEGWGSFSQRSSVTEFNASLKLEKGQLELGEISLNVYVKKQLSKKNITIRLDQKTCQVQDALIADGKINIVLKNPTLIKKGEELSIQII
ncbi:MAG TPA: hypothetical protein DCO90_18900 [Sphingobacterium sp.]|nr:hypothetical protein [Sphingobacterium sp.]